MRVSAGGIRSLNLTIDHRRPAFIRSLGHARNHGNRRWPNISGLHQHRYGAGNLARDRRAATIDECWSCIFDRYLHRYRLRHERSAAKICELSFDSLGGSSLFSHAAGVTFNSRGQVPTCRTPPSEASQTPPDPERVAFNSTGTVRRNQSHIRSETVVTLS